MVASLERKRAPHTRNRTTPEHRMAERMRPLGCADPGQSLTPIIGKALARIRNNRHSLGVASWLLGAPDGRVYVLADHPTSVRLLKRHGDWLAGRFDCAVVEPGKRPRFPTEGELFDALTQQFIDCGFLTMQAIYDEIRRIEA